MTTRFLMFLTNLLFCEHKPLFISIRLYFIKRHVWRVKMSHKTIHKAWNLFNLSEQSPENSIFRVSIGQKFLLIDRVLFLINRIGIEQQSRHPKTPGFFFYHFRSIEPKFQLIENIDFQIFLLWNHILQTQTSLLQPILVYTYIYNI